MEILQIASGVASIVALGYALWPNLTHQSVKHRTVAWYVVVFFMLITLALYFTQSGANLITQTGNIEISNRATHQHEVFYPRTYTTPPNLKINLSIGHGDLAIINQRSDGFVFKASEIGYITSEGAFVEWIASGYIDNE